MRLSCYELGQDHLGLVDVDTLVKIFSMGGGVPEG